VPKEVGKDKEQTDLALNMVL